MADKSAIEWTDATWNPVTGLLEDLARLRALLRRDVRRAVARGAGAPVRAGLRPAAGAAVAGRCRLVAAASQMVFVNSMSDLFHEDVPLDYVADVFA